MVELVNRAAAAGFVRRRPDAADARVVRVQLTGKGDQLVTQLTQAHLAGLHDLAAALHDLIPGKETVEASPPASAEGIGLPAGHA
jgi:DNA-binding MarR family transcriptional regulator